MRDFHNILPEFDLITGWDYPMCSALIFDFRRFKKQARFSKILKKLAQFLSNASFIVYIKQAGRL